MSLQYSVRKRNMMHQMNRMIYTGSLMLASAKPTLTDTLTWCEECKVTNRTGQRGLKPHACFYSAALDAAEFADTHRKLALGGESQRLRGTALDALLLV